MSFYQQRAWSSLRPFFPTITLAKHKSLAIVATAFLGYNLSTNHRHAFAEGEEESFDSSKSRVYSWGSGQYYQTGLGNIRNFNTPTNVIHLNSSKIIKIAAGGQQSMALTDDGRVYTFGRGEDARLGHGGSGNESQPRLVEALNKKHVLSISAGERHCAAVTDDGELWTWGKSASYRLGHNASQFPQRVDPLVFSGEKIVEVSCGKVHTLARTADGRVYSCGSGKSGSLGNGNRDNRKDFSIIEALKTEFITQISAGEDFSLFLTKTGKVLSCGSSDFGQSGHGQEERYTRTPRQITALKDVNVIFIETGSLHSAVVTNDGVLYTWGENKTGQLGHGDNFHRSIPHKVAGLDGIRIKRVSCGGHHTFVFSEFRDRIFAFGDGRCGQLGRGETIESVAAFRDKPVELTDTFGKENCTILEFALGTDHSLALCSQR